MRILGTTVRVFGGVSELTVEFEPGINVVVGDNESGKSTLFNAIRHGLLTPTNLDKRTLRREMEPFLPRPDGNFAEVSITLAGEERITVRRRWGADAEEEAMLQDGTIVRGPDEVSGLIERLLPVSRATFRTILLADQSQLDQTASLLEHNPAARDEAAASLRAASLAAGGVSPDAFSRLLDDRLGGLVGRWNLESDRPEGDRGHNEAWVKGAGRVVNAYYEYTRLQEELDNALQSEAELDRAQLRMEQSGATLRSDDEFLSTHASLYTELNELRGLSGEIMAHEQAIKTYRDANRRWPVLQRDIVEAEARVRALSCELNELENELAAVRKREELAAARAKLDRLESLFGDLDQARNDKEAIPAIDEKDLKALRTIESELPFAEARLASGSLRASVTSARTGEVTVTADAGEAESHPVRADESLELHASRQLVIETAELQIRVQSGEDRFEDLVDSRDTLRVEQDRLRAALGAQSVSEAEARRLERQAASRRVDELERDVMDAAGAADLKLAIAARDELAGLANATGSGDEAPAESPKDTPAGRSQTTLTDEIRNASQNLGTADGQLQHARGELGRLTEEYGTQEELENQLGESNRHLAELTSRGVGSSSVPDGFESAEAFLAEYERRKVKREAAAQENGEARVAYAELVGSQPDQTSEELRQVMEESRLVYERLLRDAHALERVQLAARRIIEEMDASVFDPFLNRVAELMGMATDDVYAPESRGEDPLRPQLFRNSGGRALAFDLLSQGTKDSLALAIRVALAETALGSASAPFILDDPFVDMDPTRRAAGARVLRRLSDHNQVIVMTCHPEHVTLFPDANVIQV